MTNGENKRAGDEPLKIAYVGPIAPYRGGIAQYGGQLVKALAKCAEVQAYSFKRQYPSWLYPGQSDKEPGMENHQVPGVHYAIGVYSPLSLRRTANDIVRSGCQVAIIAWWTLFWQPGLFYVAHRLRRKGVKVVLLCHNLSDHSAKGAKRNQNAKTKLVNFASKFLKGFSMYFLNAADGYIVHSTEGEAKLQSLKPGAKVLQRLHPIYGHFPAANKKLEKRGRLELLFFGIVRPYKGLDLMVDALAKLQDRAVHLTVAGEAWGDVEALRQQLIDTGAPNLDIHFAYIDDQTAANYFERADVVVLPYRSATGSGVLALSYHYGKPVLATRVGGLVDGVIDGKTGWLVAPDSADELAKAIAGITREKAASMKPAIEAFCKENSWEAMAEAICNFARQLR